MIRLPSREFATPEAFVQDFLDTLTPGVIPRSDFIRWTQVERKVAALTPALEFYADLGRRVRDGRDFCSEFADSLSACDDPLPYMQCALELLGHTSAELVTKQDDIDVGRLARSVMEGSHEAAVAYAEVLRDIGFARVLVREDLPDLLLGIQIGLETHRRKNVGGKHFTDEVGQLLLRLARDVSARTGVDVRVAGEVPVLYGRGLSKRVDFAIQLGRAVTVGVEVNFYTVPGSKPTEIKRSYGELREGLTSAGVDLIWITDGKGYRGMQRSLRDAYVIFPNIYNLKQAERHLADDLVALLRTT